MPSPPTPSRTSPVRSAPTRARRAIRRGELVAILVKESGAQGLVRFMQQFCDPEEMEFPYLKKALDAAGIPFIKLGVDQQMRDFGQAATAIQAFADVLSVQ